VLNEHNDYVSIVTELEFVVDKCDDDRITNIILNVKRLSNVEDKQ